MWEYPIGRCLLAVSLLLGQAGSGCAPDKQVEGAQPKVRVQSADQGPTEPDPFSRLSQVVRKRGRALILTARGGEHVQVNDHLDILATIQDPKTTQAVTVTLLQNVIVLAVEKLGPPQEPDWQITGMLLPEEAEVLLLANKLGALHVSLRNPEDIGGEEERARATVDTLATGERTRALHDKRINTIQTISPGAQTQPTAPASPSPPDQAPPLEVSEPQPEAQPEAPQRLSNIVRKRGRALTIPVSGAQHVRVPDHVDLLLVLRDPKTGQEVCLTVLQNVIVLATDGPSRLTLLVLPEEAEILVLATQLGGLTVSLRNPEDSAREEDRARATIESLFTGERVKALKKKRSMTLQCIVGGGGMGGSLGGYVAPAPTGQTEKYEDHDVNPWTETDQDRLSTFAADVDTGSYTIARRKLHAGVLPPPAAVRTEEFVNYFRYAYPAPKDAPFGVALEAARSPFAADRVLLRVGIQARRIPAAGRKPAHLTFLVDTSGSMQSWDKIGLVKRSLRFLVDQLQPGDTVAIATYAGFTAEVLPPTGMSERARIHTAIEELTAGGSTAMASGLELAYKLAWRNFQKGSINRVIVCSDGDANVGATQHGDMLQSIEHYARQGVTLSTVGFGMGNYKDHTMEQLANKGNGNYSYIDGFSQAKRVFGQDLLGTLQVIAQDVKLQVEFEPRAVTRYRLIGYENRDIADQDFRNDAVDAGEIGAGHTVTALYELELRDANRDWGTVRVRWKEPEGSSRADEKAFPIRSGLLTGGFEQASLDLQRAVLAAGLAEHLRAAPGKQDWPFERLRELARTVARGSRGKNSPDDDELLSLIEVTAQLSAERVPPSR